MKSIGLSDKISAETLHERTGGHPLAIELLEMYGEIDHRDWIRFLDSEIVDVLQMRTHLFFWLFPGRKDPCLGRNCLNQWGMWVGLRNL